MKFVSVLSLLVASVVATDINVSILPDVESADFGLEIDGPFRSCGKPGDLIAVDTIVLSPNPPAAVRILLYLIRLIVQGKETYDFCNG